MGWDFLKEDAGAGHQVLCHQKDGHQEDEKMKMDKRAKDSMRCFE
jgi:hypothetical protein